MAQKDVILERETKERTTEKLTPEEQDSLERDPDIGETADVADRIWHTGMDKKSDSVDKDWAYIDDGFDEEMARFDGEDGKVADYVGDVQNALSSWRISLNNNHVLDDILGHSQDVPSATAYGELIRLLDEYDRRLTGWSPATQSLRASIKRLKGTATRLNESMMKTAAECYSDMDEDTTYRELTEIGRDPVGYKMRKTIAKQNKRIMERLNSYDDEIRGEKDMHEVIGAFLPQGQGDKWTTEEKQQCDQFIDDYVSRDIKRRRPHLERITSQMIDLSVSLDMLAPEYLASHGEQMEYILKQISYFLTIRNDPVNADYFRRLPESVQRKLDIVNRIGTSFTTGDFVKNIAQVRQREDMYKPTGRDQIRVDAFMSRGDMNANMSGFAYDNKVFLESYKRDRY